MNKDGPKSRPLEDRFWEKVDKNGPIPAHRPELGPCWVWTSPLNAVNGYGEIGRGGKHGGRISAHRVAFFLAHGRWPSPCALHHCDTPSCVKAEPDALGPPHIFEGTNQDNVRDMHAKGRSWQRRRTHCPKGHPYDEANTRITNRGKRCCRACHRQGCVAL